MIQTTKYVRKPFTVDAVQVTEENLQEVARWCQGTIETDEDRVYIKVHVARALNKRQTKAYPGDWVLYAGTGFKVYTGKAFYRTFELLEGEARDATDQALKGQLTIEDKPAGGDAEAV